MFGQQSFSWSTSNYLTTPSNKSLINKYMQYKLLSFAKHFTISLYELYYTPFPNLQKPSDCCFNSSYICPSDHVFHDQPP